MNDKDTDLLPCPFCGGEAAFGTIRYSSKMVREQEWTQDVFHTVGCISCGSSTQKITGHKTQDGAAESWNARVDPALDRLTAENERLRTATRYALATFRALEQYTFADSDHGLLIAEAVKKLEDVFDALEGGEDEDER